MEIRDLELIVEISDEEAATLTGGISSPGLSSQVSDAIAQFQAAQVYAAVQSITVATEITRINGIYNAIKKIGPG